MKRISTICLIFCLFGIGTHVAYPQIPSVYGIPKERQKYVTLFAGPSFPVGTFSETYSNGAAKLGVSAGLDYIVPIEEQYEIGMTGAFNYQPFDKDNLRYRYGVENVRSGGVVINLGYDYCRF